VRSYLVGCAICGEIGTVESKAAAEVLQREHDRSTQHIRTLRRGLMLGHREPAQMYAVIDYATPVLA